MSSIWGHDLQLSIFGGSHSQGIGATISGLPAGLEIDMAAVQLQMNRRAPGGQAYATARQETDVPEVLSGMDAQGRLTGDPVGVVIRNKDHQSTDYRALKAKPRPGHADYPAYVKYKGFNDVRGGGHFSGRLTAPLVFAGALCRQLLAESGITIGAHASEIAGVRDEALLFESIDPAELKQLSETIFPVRSAAAKKAMLAAIEEASAQGDSVGGCITCAAAGLPVGLGSPMFGGVENRIASIIFGIPAIKGIAFGEGFRSASLRGSENNDPYVYREHKVRLKTNHSGGALGGITTGMPLVFTVAVKPTPSIARQQETVNLETGENATLEIKGRHDPCIVPRAVPVVEAACAVALADLILENGRCIDG